MIGTAFLLAALQGSLMSYDDYPKEAVRRGWQGDVKVDLTIDTGGRVSACKVAESSGHSVLDVQTCKIFTQRARFKPAVDDDGRTIQDHYVTSLKWRRLQR